MPGVEETLDLLLLFSRHVIGLERDREKSAGPGVPEDYRLTLDKQIREWQEKIVSALKNLVRYPPYHVNQFETLKSFYGNGAAYEDSVFIMTKFPRDPPAAAEDKRLKEIIEEVSSCLKNNGYHPRIASESRAPYHPLLWDNVEAYLFCCGNGVAIVEDKYQAEFNPNVAMEWGWMRGMKKKVLYLIEKEFKHLRADTAGMIFEEFLWSDPKPGIKAAIDRYFPPRAPTKSG